MRFGICKIICTHKLDTLNSWNDIHHWTLKVCDKVPLVIVQLFFGCAASYTFLSRVIITRSGVIRRFFDIVSKNLIVYGWNNDINQPYQHLFVQKCIGWSWEWFRRLWEKFVGILKQEKAIFRFFEIPWVDKLCDPSRDGKELLVDNQSLMGRMLYWSSIAGIFFRPIRPSDTELLKPKVARFEGF